MRLNRDCQTTDRGVSPVIGVILMVAITVILAGIIGVFVMNLGPPEEQAPTAQWELQEQSDRVIITHDGGEAATASELKIVVETLGSDGGAVTMDGGTNEMTTNSSTFYGSDVDLAATDGFEIVGTGNSVDEKGVVMTNEAASNILNVALLWEADDNSQPLDEWEL